MKKERNKKEERGFIFYCFFLKIIYLTNMPSSIYRYIINESILVVLGWINWRKEAAQPLPGVKNYLKLIINNIGRAEKIGISHIKQL